MAGTLWLGLHTRSTHQLTIRFGLDDLHFSASYWYADVDLTALEDRYGSDALERVYFHIAAFTANCLVSLRPERLDPGPYARFCSPRFQALWTAIIRGVWAQWRYEHDDPDYLGPALADGEGLVPAVPLRADDGPVPVLALCGGGKDSVVSLRLLEASGVQSDTLVYSSSTYGAAAHQHALCDSLLDALRVPQPSRRRVWWYDDVADSPVAALHPEHGASKLTTAETPLSVFVSLPLVLQHGYRNLCLAHERSADAGNVRWARTGESVNHQWGKSTECQDLLNDYVASELVEGCRYFSIVKPIYDVLIFNLLAETPATVPFTHSCNERKPWCGRCAKCAYVWLNYRAYLPDEVVSATFGGLGNLLDVPENQLWFRQLLGLEDHSPFECVGEVDEARLAFELCRRKGLRGAAMTTFVREVPAVDVAELLERYLAVNDDPALLPDFLRARVLNRMRSSATRVRAELSLAVAAR